MSNLKAFLESCSDEQINKGVAWCMSRDSFNLSKYYDEGPFGSGVDYFELVLNFNTDYCANPIDAWPIILSNRINLCPYDSEKEWYATTDTSFFIDDVNPLRAAMIAYLLMEAQS